MAKANKSKDIAMDALYRLSHLAPNTIKNTETLGSLGITADLLKILPDLLSNSAHADQVTLDTSSLSKSLKSKSTVADIVSAVRVSSQEAPTGKVSPAKKVARASKVASASGYPATSAAEDVAAVIGRFKNISPSSIAASDKLAIWHFSSLEKRALAQSINLYYKNVKQLKMAPWIHPSETGAAKLVADLIRIVVSHNPH